MSSNATTIKQGSSILRLGLMELVLHVANLGKPSALKQRCCINQNKKNYTFKIVL